MRRYACGSQKHKLKEGKKTGRSFKMPKIFLIRSKQNLKALVFKSMIRERFMIANEKIKMTMRIKMLLNQKFGWPTGT